jgi:hypothetical protein
MAEPMKSAESCFEKVKESKSMRPLAGRSLRGWNRNFLFGEAIVRRRPARSPPPAPRNKSTGHGMTR